MGGNASSYIFIRNALIVIFAKYRYKNGHTKKISKHLSYYLLFGLSFIILHALNYSYFYLFLAIILFSFAEIIIQIRLDYDATNIDERLIASAYGVMSLSSAFGGMAGSYLGSLLSNQDFFGLSIW
ncbi:hypothetical protein [Bartonella silvatica]|uniref:hypothetical protein n=1 Tax=Bartonella silvatica TaxID=357760 RepID=UPI00339637AD